MARQPDGAEADVDLLGVLALELQRRARRVRRRVSSGGAGSPAAQLASVLLASSTIWSWSTEPAAAITIEPGT